MALYDDFSTDDRPYPAVPQRPWGKPMQKPKPTPAPFSEFDVVPPLAGGPTPTTPPPLPEFEQELLDRPGPLTSQYEQQVGTGDRDPLDLQQSEIIDRDRGSWEQRLRQEAAALGLAYEPSDVEDVIRQMSYAANAGRDPEEFIQQAIARYRERATSGGGGSTTPGSEGGGTGGSSQQSTNPVVESWAPAPRPSRPAPPPPPEPLTPTVASRPTAQPDAHVTDTDRGGTTNSWWHRRRLR